MKTRLSFDVTPQEHQEMLALKDAVRAGTLIQLVRQSLALTKAAHDHVVVHGGKVIFETKNGERQVLLSI